MTAPHDVLLVDLDGTVYQGEQAIDGAVEALDAVRGRGVPVGYVTNNASRAPQDVAAHLARLGLTVTDADVVTSAQAGAALLAERCAAGSPVLVVGTEALVDEVRGVGLTPVRAADDRPVGVVQGHSPDTDWHQLAEATLALGAGGEDGPEEDGRAVWVACNVDVTLPSERGMLPGNGAMVAALRAATGREPVVAGKPAAPLLRHAVERYHATRPLVIGDRLDTDIAGAHTIEAESLLVLTGVSTATDLLAADPERRPTYLGADLGVLADLEASRIDVPPTTRNADDTDEADATRNTGAWTVGMTDGPDGPVLELAGEGDPIAALRALCVEAWRAGTTTVRGAGPTADTTLATLGLRTS